MRLYSCPLLIGLLLHGSAAVCASELSLRDGVDRRVSLERPAQRIIALSRGSMEIALALNVGLVGRPVLRGENLPESLADLPAVGNAVTPNFEIMLQLEPDLILAPANAHGSVAERLDALRVPMYLTHAKSVADVLSSIRDVGALTGREVQAAALCTRLEQELAEMRTDLPSVPRRSLLLFGTPQAFLVVAPWSYAGDLLRLAGGDNVATDILADVHTSHLRSLELLPLSLEDVLLTNPEVIIVISHGRLDVIRASLQKDLGSHAAWQELDAVQQAQVHVLPADLLSGDLGPNFPRAVQALREILHARHE